MDGGIADAQVDLGSAEDMDLGRSHLHAGVAVDEHGVGLDGVVPRRLIVSVAGAVDVHVVAGPDLHLLIGGHGDRLAVHVQRASRLDPLVAVDLLHLVAHHVQRPIPLHGPGLVPPDLGHRVALDHLLEVPLRVHREPLGPRGVVHQDLVVPLAARRRPRAPHADRLLLGQLERRREHRVVDAANDQRLVRIPVQVGHHHLVPTARQHDEAIAVAGPAVRHAHPPRGRARVLVAPIPVELDEHAAVLVHVDLVAVGRHHERRLRAADPRLCPPHRPEAVREVHQLELVRAALVGLHHGARAHHEQLAREIGARVILDRHPDAGLRGEARGA